MYRIGQNMGKKLRVFQPPEKHIHVFDLANTTRVKQ